MYLLGRTKRHLSQERIVIGDYQEPEPLEKMDAEDMFEWANTSNDSWHNSVTGEK